MLRKLFIPLTLLLWLATIFIALEVVVRWNDHRQEAEINAHIEKTLQAGREADAAYLIAHPASHSAISAEHLPTRETFYELPEEGRHALAKQRGELILGCDETGAILCAYKPASDSLSRAMLSFFDQIETGKSIFDLLNPAQRDDARAGLNEEMRRVGFFAREYWVAANGKRREDLFEFFFVGNQRDDTALTFTLWIQESIWEIQGVKFKPNIRRHGLFNSDIFCTNAQGFRDFDIVLPKPPEVYRILCIGGSTTFEGPRTDLTYPKMLERMLRGHFKTERIEVINCGVLSLDSVGEKARIPDYLALEPDLIIHYNFVNDLYGRLHSSIYPQLPLLRPLRWIKWRLKDSALVFNFFPRLYLPTNAAFLEQVRTVTMANLRTLGRRAQQQGASVAFCSFAYPYINKHDRLDRAFFNKQIRLSLGDMRLGAIQYGRYARLYAQEVHRLCQKEGWHYIPVAENIQGGTEYFSDICHMYCAGMELKASVIFEAIHGLVAEELHSR